MAEKRKSDQLDDAVEALLMADRNGPTPPVSPQLEALLRIAGDLRDLPKEEFRNRLKADLLSRAGAERSPQPNYGKVLLSEEDIVERFDQMAHQPGLLPFDLATGLSDLPDRTMRFFAFMNESCIGVSRGSGISHWEWHKTDELLYFLEGEGEVVTLTDDGPVRTAFRPGTLLVCPRQLWHRTEPRSPISMFFITPSATEATGGEPPVHKGERRATPPIAAHNLHDVLGRARELRISDRTTEEEANASFHSITRFDQCTLGLTKFTGLTPWERHPGGDELLYAVDGVVELTVLTDDGPVQTSIGAGSVFVCPRGLWHRQLARESVTIVYGTATETTEISFADDPRAGA